MPTADQRAEWPFFKSEKLNRLLHYWFVVYNPLYFLSAMLIVFGVFLVSHGLQQTLWWSGQIILTGVIEVYQLLLIGSASVLLRKTQLRRPAVVLSVIAIVFMGDCTFQTEHLSALDGAGALSSALWFLMVGIKLKLLAGVFKVELPWRLAAIALSIALGIVLMPYVVAAFSAEKHLAHLAATWYGAVLMALMLHYKPQLTCALPLRVWGQTVLRRMGAAAVMIWMGLYLYHLVAWSLFYDIPLSGAHLTPFVLVAAVKLQREKYVWALTAIAMALSIPTPWTFWGGAACTALVFLFKSIHSKNKRYLLGTILALHFALLTRNWMQGAFPDAGLWLNILTALALLAFTVYSRQLVGFLTLCGGAVYVLKSKGPYSLVEWGIISIALGFVALVGGVYLNVKAPEAIPPQKKTSIPG